MKNSLKTLRAVLLLIVIFLVVAVVIIDLFADRAVKMGIETAAAKTLDVGVSIDDVDLSIIGGRLGLQTLVIDNPPGYQHDKLLELRDAQIEVEIRSLLDDTVNVKDIRLDGVNVVLEQKGISSNNLQDVIEAIRAGTKTEGQPEKPGRKLYIDNLEISDVTVQVKLLPVPGKADTVTLKLSPIKMKNLGRDRNLDTAALTGKILLAIAAGVAEQGAGVLPEDVVGTMKSALDMTIDLGKAASEKGQELIDVGKDLVEGLLKPKKKE